MNASASSSPISSSLIDTHARSTCKLIPYRDPWQMAKPRFWDIDDQPLQEFIDTGQFAYTNQQVILTYATQPTNPYFVGHIQAKGLKPNFAYQMKLLGKPVYGERGWGKFGDDLTNERLGKAGRWWEDVAAPPGPNIDDAYYEANYKDAPIEQKRTIYGYLYMGAFVTDEQGNADVDFSSQYSYHICWQDKQIKGQREVVAGEYTVQSTLSPYYGYGHPVAPRPVRLWYEYQWGRSREVNLPPGTYNCRFLITEETFHNLMGGMDDPTGGFYQSVLCSEDFDAHGHPDSDESNDIVFTIKD